MSSVCLLLMYHSLLMKSSNTVEIFFNLDNRSKFPFYSLSSSSYDEIIETSSTSSSLLENDFSKAFKPAIEQNFTPFSPETTSNLKFVKETLSIEIQKRMVVKFSLFQFFYENGSNIVNRNTMKHQLIIKLIYTTNAIFKIILMN